MTRPGLKTIGLHAKLCDVFEHAGPKMLASTILSQIVKPFSATPMHPLNPTIKPGISNPDIVLPETD